MATDDKGSMSSNSNLDTPQGKRRREVEHRLRLYRHIGGTIAIVVSIATLIVGGIEFYLQQQANSKMEVDQQRQTTLDTYLDRIQELMLKDNFKTCCDAQALAGARTFTVIRYLDGYRKAYAIRFLYDVRLIGYVDNNGTVKPPIIDVPGADLSGAVFATATQYPNMPGVSLTSDNLYGANLSGVTLTDADLSNTYLQGANLSGAILCGADLSRATYNTKTIQVTDVQGNTLTLGPTQWRGATYNPEPIQVKDAQGNPVKDAQGNPVTIRPTQWPQGFNPKAAGATTTSNDC